MFQYFNARVPVIANNLEGLKVISDFNAGVVIDHLGSKAIKKGLDEITEYYDDYIRGASVAARSFDFERSIQPFNYFLKS